MISFILMHRQECLCKLCIGDGMERTSIFNRRMLLAVCLAVILMGHTYLREPNLTGQDVLGLVLLPMSTAMFGPFACIFPALPYSMSFAEEYNTSFSRFVLIRSNRKKYAFKKTLSVGISGGIMMAAALGIIFGIAVIFGKPSDGNCETFSYDGTIWYPYLAIWGGKFVLLLKLFLGVLFGMIWSQACLLFSVISLNRYVAFIGTFIIYQFLWQALASSKWNPIYLLWGNVGGYTDIWEPYAFQSLMIIVLFLINQMAIRRRLEYA